MRYNFVVSLCRVSFCVQPFVSFLLLIFFFLFLFCPVLLSKIEFFDFIVFYLVLVKLYSGFNLVWVPWDFLS